MSAFLLLWIAAAAPQDSGDAGVLVVRTDSVDVAREQFRLARTAGVGAGWTLASAVRYDRARPAVTLRPTLQLGADSLPSALQFDVTDGAGSRRLLAQPGPERLTIRELAPGVERAREVRATGRVVILDDSVFAPYAVAAWHARTDPVTLTAVYPRSGRRETLTASDRGMQSTMMGRAATELRLVELAGGSTGVVRVWLDPGGRLMKVEMPDRRCVAERVLGG